MAKARNSRRLLLTIGVAASFSVGVVDSLVLAGSRQATSSTANATSDAPPDTSAVTKFLKEAREDVSLIARAEKPIICDITTDPAAPPQNRVKEQLKIVKDADRAVKIVVRREKVLREKVSILKSEAQLKLGEAEALNKQLAKLRSAHQKAQVRASDSLMEVASVLERAAKNEIRLQDAKAADAALHRGKLSSEVSLLKQLGDQLGDSSESEDADAGAMNFLQVRSSRPERKAVNTSGAAALLLEADRRALLAASVAQLRDFRKEERKLMKLIAGKRKELAAIETTLSEQRALLAEAVREIVQRKDALATSSAQNEIYQALQSQADMTCTLRNQTQTKVAGMRQAVLDWMQASLDMLDVLAKQSSEDASVLLAKQQALTSKYAALFQAEASDSQSDLSLDEAGEQSRDAAEDEDADEDADEDGVASPSSSASSISMLAPISVLASHPDDNDDEVEDDDVTVDPKQMAALQQASDLDFAALAQQDSEAEADDKDFDTAEALSTAEEEEDVAAPSLVQLDKSVKQQELGAEVAQALAEAEGNKDSDSETALLEESAGGQSEASVASSASMSEGGQTQGPFDSVVALMKQLIDEIQDQSNKDANKNSFCQNAESENSRNRVRAKTALHQSKSFLLKSKEEAKRLDVARKQMKETAKFWEVMEKKVIKKEEEEKGEQKSESKLGHSLKIKVTTALNLMRGICHQRQALFLDVGGKTSERDGSSSSSSIDFCKKVVTSLESLKQAIFQWSRASDDYIKTFETRASNHRAIMKAAVKANEVGFEDLNVKQAKLKKDLAETEADFKKQTEELANLAKASRELKDQCTVKDTIDDRIARLTDQIEKLRGALRVLGGDDIPV